MVGIDALSKLLYCKMQVRSGRVPCVSTFFPDDEARPDFFSDFVVDFGEVEIGGFKSVEMFDFDVVSTAFGIPTCFGNDSIKHGVNIFVVGFEVNSVVHFAVPKIGCILVP